MRLRWAADLRSACGAYLYVSEQVEEVVAHMEDEQRLSADRVAELNQQIRGLMEKTDKVDDFDALAAERNDLVAELQEMRGQLAATREELDAWQRQTMVLTQPLYRDSVVLLLLEAMRLYPKLDVLQVESLAALQNVISPENPAEILDNCGMIREFGGIGIVLSTMRDNLTHERIQCNACSLLWKVFLAGWSFVLSIIRLCLAAANSAA